MDIRKSANYFDTVRQSGGSGKLVSQFSKLARYSRQKALYLLNDEGLLFPSLFVLGPVINHLGLSGRLSTRHKSALEIIDTILKKKATRDGRLTSTGEETAHAVLRWMLETGHTEDSTDSRYDEVMDIASVLLIRHYKDKALLHIIMDMLFSRYRKGVFSHTLAWAFFECCDPQCLIMAAERLKSSDPRDFELARKLLCFVPCIKVKNGADTHRLYEACIYWIMENLPFLYRTDESFQLTHNPVSYAVSYEAKYLFVPVDTHTGKITATLSPEQAMLLNGFSRLDSVAKARLSGYSCLLRKQNPYWWSYWLRCPLEEQVRSANFTQKEGG